MTLSRLVLLVGIGLLSFAAAPGYAEDAPAVDLERLTES